MEFNINADNIGIIGDNAHIEGGYNVYQYFVNRSRAIPRELPPRAPHFTGREEEVTELIEMLAEGQVVTIWGLGGMGKTALAGEVVNHLPDNRFPDGVIFFSFYHQPDIQLAYHHIIKLYDPNSTSFTQDEVRQVLGNKKALIVLDGTEKVSDLQDLLDVCGMCTVLITSRTREDVRDKVIELKPLPIEQSVQLVQRWGREYAGDQDTIQEICKYVDCLPLALMLIGKYLYVYKESAPRYAQWLHTTPLQALDQGKRSRDSVPILLDRTMEMVGEMGVKLLTVTGCMALSWFNLAPIEKALTIPEQDLRAPVNKLVSYGILTRGTDREDNNTFSIIHPLVYEYVCERLTPDHDILERLANYYKMLATEQNQRELDGYLVLDAERSHIVRVLERCGQAQQWEAVLDLAENIMEYLEVRSYLHNRIAVANLAIQAAKGFHDLKRETFFLIALGNAYVDQKREKGGFEYYEQAMCIAKETGDRHQEGVIAGNIGSAYGKFGDIQNALKFYEIAMNIAHELDDKKEEGDGLNNLGIIYMQQNKVNQAIECYEEGLQIARSTKNKITEGIILGNMGIIYRNMGIALGNMNYIERAVSCCKQALEISGKIGHRLSEGNQLIALGDMYFRLGKYEEAMDCNLRAAKLAEQSANKRIGVNSIYNTACIYAAQGNVDEACRHIEQAINLDPSLYEEARNDLDFANIRDTDCFKHLFEESGT